MKRIITSASNSKSPYTRHNTYERGRQKYSVHISDYDVENNPGSLKAQISEIHPYDEAEYAWARLGSKGAMQVEFIRNGKIINTMQMPYYDPEDYETEDEYVDEVLDSICVELSIINEKVEPLMSHY